MKKKEASVTWRGECCNERARQSAPLECHVIPERAARLPANPESANPESRQAHTALVTAGARLSLKPDLLLPNYDTNTSLTFPNQPAC